MAAAGAPLRCTVPECRWFTGAALTPEQQTHQLAKHLRDVHATFPRESKLFVLPPAPCGVMVSNDPRAMCSKESDHAGPHDIVQDRHAFAPEEPDDAEALAYLNALRMVARAIEAGGADVDRATSRAVLLADIRHVVALYGRTLELGGAREGRS